jgi:deoxyribonuclease-4
VLLGAHESTAGGLHLALERGLADGAEAVQIFTKSSRMWAAKEIAVSDAALFRAESKKASLPGATSVHASYLINLGCADPAIRRKGIQALADELSRCDQLGVPYLVLHPGSCEDAEAGIRAIARGMDEAFRASRGPCTLLLETAAGQGSALGRSFEELRAMRDACKTPDRVAYCLDTCHVFAAGLDIASERGYQNLFERFDAVLGLSRLRAFHLNDSKKPLGCRVDRHEHVGEGCIGEPAFRRLVNDPRFALVPGYLEIPPERNKKDLARLRSWRSRGPGKVPPGKPGRGTAPAGRRSVAKTAALD